MSPKATIKRIAVVALLTALLVLGVAVLPALANTTSGSGGSFGLDSAAASPEGESTGDLLGAAKDTTEPESTVAEAVPTQGTTMATTTEATATPQQPSTTYPNTVQSQYQQGSLADTGGVPPSRPLILGLILGAGVLGVALANRRGLARLANHTNNRKDDDVFFG